MFALLCGAHAALCACLFARLQVSKPHKLVMFTIPKVSCTEFIRLFFRLKGDRQWAMDPHFRKGKPLLKDLPIQEVG